MIGFGVSSKNKRYAELREGAIAVVELIAAGVGFSFIHELGVHGIREFQIKVRADIQLLRAVFIGEVVCLPLHVSGQLT